MRPEDVAGRYSVEDTSRGVRLRLRGIDRVPRDTAPPTGMPPLMLMLLDAVMDGAETLDTARDYGEEEPHGLALVGETHLIEAARALVSAGFVQVEETQRGDTGEWVSRRVEQPATDDESLLRYWYRPTTAGRQEWRDAKAILDAYYDDRNRAGDGS